MATYKPRIARGKAPYISGKWVCSSWFQFLGVVLPVIGIGNTPAEAYKAWNNSNGVDS